MRAAQARVDRVQRVPVTESQGRIHTSAVGVLVLPEAEDVDVTIDPNDLRIDVYRSSGPGGQSVNTTDSAVRSAHVPTGVGVSCQNEKSQLQNKAKALQVLRARLLQAEQDKAAAEASDLRKGQIGGGGRSAGRRRRRGGGGGRDGGVALPDAELRGAGVDVDPDPAKVWSKHAELRRAA